jgi:DNA-binding CsgD family transcriptional regulator
LATRSRPNSDSTSAGRPAKSRKQAQASVSDLLLLAELHEHLPVRLLAHDAETLEVLHASEADDPLVTAPELVSAVREVAASGRRRHVPELRQEDPGPEPRWWSATLHRVDTDRWGRVVVTLAVEVTEQVRARRLLEERGRRQSNLRETIAAVRRDDLAASLQRAADAVVSALQVDVATLRLLDDAGAELHLVAASGLRPSERRRLALEPITPRRLEMIVEGSRHPLVETLGVNSIELRWLEARGDRIGTLTIGARSEQPLPDYDLAELDAAAAQLSAALKTIKRSPQFLRSRSLEMARASAPDEQAIPTRADGLRPRELAILRLYGEGHPTDRIAELLVLSPHTVRTHVRNARRRLGVSSRAAALDVLKATDPVI